jgi:hypothetical protein
MKKNIKISKKKTNKINNRKRSLTGGRIIPPKWQQYGYKTEAAYLDYLEEVEQQRERERIERERRERIEREKRERVINAVLTNVLIQSIMTLIMNPDQSQRFEAYIRENIRIVNSREELDPMIDVFINFARTDLLDEEQTLLTNRILNAVQKKRRRRAAANQAFGPIDILDIIDRVFGENIYLTRSGGGKKKYYKRFTRKNISNRRK